MKKFNRARVDGESKYDSLEAGIAINWRSAWATNSYKVLKEVAELAAWKMEILSQTVLQETYKIWRVSYRDDKA